ncbi:MAG: hypothetical protein H6667_04645 [Ardenticatenaceae bacterium]|nr:hypothetical protein [Ardenticatenaceae bacterium]MCB9446506.1 hypothetical protein [Ardenticatenaceae bacterium]
MKSHYLRLLLSVMLITVMGLLLVACGGGEEPTPTPEVVNTPVPPPPTDTPVPPPPTDTPAPTETPVPEVVVAYTRFESAESGFAINYPEDWFTDGMAGFTTFASAEELMDSPDPGEEGGVALVISGPAADFEGTDAVAMLQQMSDEMDPVEDMEITDGPTAVTINGNDGATMYIKGTTDNGTPLSVFMTLVTNGDYVVIMVAATPQETEADFKPIFEDMANSIEVFEPTAPPLPESEGTMFYGETKSGTVTEAGPSTWNFIGLEGEQIDIIARPLADDFDLAFDLLDESGNSVLDIEVDESFGTEELRGFTLPSGGLYTISIYGFAGSVGDYEVTLAEAGAMSGTAAGSLVYGNLMTGAVVSGESAIWTFTGQARDFVDITVAPYDFDLTVDVLDPNGNSLLDEAPLDESFDTEFIRVLSLLEDGTYTIVVNGFEGEFGDYDILVDLSNGGQPGSIVFAADTLEESETEDGHAFPFTALAGEVVKFYVDPEFGFDTVIEIVNDDTDAVLEDIDATTGFEEAVFNVPEDGNYYFLVKGFEGSFGAYDATLLGSDFAIFELAGGDGVVGQFGSDGRIDYIYRGQAGDTITFTAETNDDLDLVLSMTDLDDNPLATVDEFVAGGSETLSYTFTEDLIVFLTVSEFSATPGEFYLYVDLQ